MRQNLFLEELAVQGERQRTASTGGKSHHSSLGSRCRRPSEWKEAGDNAQGLPSRWGRGGGGGEVADLQDVRWPLTDA